MFTLPTTVKAVQHQVAEDSMASRFFFSQARHFERVGDLASAQQAHVDSDYHDQRAQAGLDLLARLAAAGRAA